MFRVVETPNSKAQHQLGGVSGFRQLQSGLGLNLETLNPKP